MEFGTRYLLYIYIFVVHTVFVTHVRYAYIMVLLCDSQDRGNSERDTPVLRDAER